MPRPYRSLFQSIVAIPTLLLSSSLLMSGCDGENDPTITGTTTSSSQAVSSQVASSQAASSQGTMACLTPGAPACWALTPKNCAPGSLCETLYEVGDNCSVKRWEADFTVSFVKPGTQDCGPVPSSSSESSTSSSDAGFTNTCEYAAGRRYESETLHEVNHGSLGHWALTFDTQGHFYSIQSDFGLRGTYRCDNNTALLTYDGDLLPPVEATFLDARATRLRFNPFAGEDPITFTLKNLGATIPACAETAGFVCGVVNTGRVCVTSPCPSQVFETFANRCQAEKAKAQVAFEGPCGDYEGRPTSDGETGPICNKLYAPVCAKKDQRALVLCVSGTECNAYQYMSYGNACEARAEQAQFAFDGQCSTYDLEGVFSNAFPPALLTHDLPSGFALLKSSIEGDVLTFTAGYSGCSERHLNLYVDEQAFTATATGFPLTMPISPAWSLSDGQADHVTCAAAFSTTHRVDLTPLKAAFRKAFPTAPGVIHLGKLGDYRF